MNQIVEVRGVRIGEGIPKICVPVSERTQEEVLAAAMSMRKEPFDLVEWRADWYLDVLEPKQVRETLQILREVLGQTPIIFTVRTAKEGGELELSVRDYERILTDVAASGLADLIDVELFAGDDTVRNIVRAAKDSGTAVIASSHEFTETPPADELVARMERMRELGADILKIAVMPERPEDVLTLLEATGRAKRETGEPLITMAMGGLGLISRVCGETFGSDVTFGAAGKASAPGQMDVRELDEVLLLLHRGIQGSAKRDTRDFGKQETQDLFGKKNNLYLIGFMACGKSASGACLAKKTGMRLIEMDNAIEKKAGKSIPEIFREDGEKHFRDLETASLAEIANEKGCIVSCGGGAAMREENVRLMKESGRIVLLTATPQTIFERVKGGTDRPLLQNRMSPEKIGELMDERRPYYEAASDLVVSTDQKTIEEVAEEIIGRIAG